MDESTTVRAFVDGRSQIILQGQTAQWLHLDYAAPGRIACNEGAPVEPTYINGVAWFPEWPDVPDCENRFCDCSSDVFEPVTPGVPELAQAVDLEIIACRSSCYVVQHPSAANGFRVVVEFNDNGVPGADWYEVVVRLEPCEEVSSYCSSLPNSTGQAAQLALAGSTSVAQNDAVLSATSCPPETIGIFCYGKVPAELPFGDGYLCISPVVPGLFRLQPAAATSASGEAVYPLDHGLLPAGGEIAPGATWYFQYWFRDAASAGHGFNLTQGLAVQFCP